MIIEKSAYSLDGRHLSSSDRLRTGDAVALWREPFEDDAEQPPLPVVHEDPYLLVIDKPALVVVHPTARYHRHTVKVRLEAARPGEFLALIHRIDRETSGLLLLGKHPQATRQLQEQFRVRATSKRYFALLDGRLPEDWLAVEQPLAKTVRGGERFMVTADAGQDALTEFRRLENRGKSTFVEAVPVTGRTHQIRAHAVWLGMPCAGDARYSEEKRLGWWHRRGLQRLFLHAHALEITAPDGEVLHLSSPLPPDLAEILDILPV
jgi:RluA family pseudouridine synthase